MVMFACNVNKLVAVYVSPLQVASVVLLPTTCLQLQTVPEQVVVKQCLCTLKKRVCVCV